MSTKSPRFYLLLLILIGLLAVAGCSSGGSGNSDNNDNNDLTVGKTAAQIAEESYKKQYEAKNYDMDFFIRSSVMIMDEKIVMDIAGYGNMFLDPLKVKLVMEIAAPSAPVPGFEDGTVRTEQYIIAEGDELVSYQSQGDQWFKMAFTDANLKQLMQFNPADNLKLFMDNLKDAAIVGDEIVNGVNTVKIDLTASGDLFKDLMEEMDSLGLGSQIDLLTSDILSGIGDLAFNIWVDKATLDMVKGAVDLTPILQNLSAVMKDSVFPGMETMTPEEMEMILAMFDNMDMSMEYYVMNIDKAQDFSLPPEAADAIDLGAFELP